MSEGQYPRIALSWQQRVDTEEYGKNAKTLFASVQMDIYPEDTQETVQKKAREILNVSEPVWAELDAFVTEQAALALRSFNKRRG